MISALIFYRTTLAILYLQVTSFLITFAGTPAAKALGGISFVTIELDAITAPSPIFTPLVILTPEPIQTLFPIVIF